MHAKPHLQDLQDVPSSEATGPIESGSPAPSQKSIPLNSPTPKSAALQLGYGTTPSARRPPLINAQLSRLRSSRRFPSSSSYSSFASDFKNRSAVEEMHFNFGTLSRHSSMSNIRDHPASTGMSDSNIIDLEALSKLASSTTLRWNPLRKISARVFSGPAPPLQNGAANGHQQQHLGQPTCMATSGVICIGTSKGWTMVFDFAQSLQGICGNETLCSQPNEFASRSNAELSHRLPKWLRHCSSSLSRSYFCGCRSCLRLYSPLFDVQTHRSRSECPSSRSCSGARRSGRRSSHQQRHQIHRLHRCQTHCRRFFR